MFYDEETRKKYWRIVCATAISVFLLMGVIFAIAHNKSNQDSVPVDNFSEDNKPYYSSEQATRLSDNNLEEGTIDIETSEYRVISVTDGDTIRVDYNGTSTPVRLIGVDTPETVDPRKTVECFGAEASNYLNGLLVGKRVSMEADPTQSDRDKYDRLLRYVYIVDGENSIDVALSIIKNGYGHEYTYNVPYQKQSEYKAAENEAKNNDRGLWAPNACGNQAASSDTSIAAPEASQLSPSDASNYDTCTIKGNINSKGEKIYHVPGQKYYNDTKIDPAKGERYFCSKSEAEAAGWRAAKV